MVAGLAQQADYTVKPGEALPPLKDDWSADGLILATLANEYVGTTYYDATGDLRHTASPSSTTNVTRANGKIGYGVNITSTGGHALQILGAPQGTPAFLDGLNTYSLIWAGSHTGTSGFRGIFEAGAWNQSGGAGAFFVDTPENVEHWVSNFLRATSGNSFINVSGYSCYGITRNAGEYRFFRDGLLHSTDSSGYTTAASYNASFDDIQIFGAGSTSLYPYTGTHDIFLLYNRTLSDWEVCTLTANPLTILDTPLVVMIVGAAPLAAAVNYYLGGNVMNRGQRGLGWVK